LFACQAKGSGNKQFPGDVNPHSLQHNKRKPDAMKMKSSADGAGRPKQHGRLSHKDKLASLALAWAIRNISPEFAWMRDA